MANVDAPNGLTPHAGNGNGNPAISYHVLLATNVEIGEGAPVAVVAGGVDKWSSGAVLGVAAEYKAANAGGATATKMIAVYSDPAQEFTAQCDNGTGTATSEAAVGLNITFLTGTAVNRRSIEELDESSATTTATLPLKIMGLQNIPNNAYGEFNRFIVKINNHQLKGGTGTAGI